MLKKVIQSISTLLLFTTLIALAWVPARAEDMTCPDHTPVVIDIKPGSYPNTIKLSSQGLLPVAVISTPDFNASLFVPEMAHLNDANTPMSSGCPGAMALRWVRDDVNGDGQPDIVFFFSIQDLDFTSKTTAANLMAHGAYGASIVHILGTDSVKVIP